MQYLYGLVLLIVPRTIKHTEPRSLSLSVTLLVRASPLPPPPPHHPLGWVLLLGTSTNKCGNKNLMLVSRAITIFRATKDSSVSRHYTLLPLKHTAPRIQSLPSSAPPPSPHNISARGLQSSVVNRNVNLAVILPQILCFQTQRFVH